MATGIGMGDDVMLRYETELGKLHEGDCLEVMDELIKQGVKVDAVITDVPY
jgi:DNA modification methylase